jgi:hypothetical protein
LQKLDWYLGCHRVTPETHYAHSDKLSIAYQVVGDGPVDLVVVPGWISNIEVFWEDAHVARFFEKLAAFSRLILFDKRGTGLSDRSVETATMEERMDDVRAVLDAVGSNRAALLGISEGGPRPHRSFGHYWQLCPASSRARLSVLHKSGRSAKGHRGSRIRLGRTCLD